MDKQKFAKDKHSNLKINNPEIKEELPNFDAIQNFLEVEISPSGLSYGEVFIENQQSGAFTWWISCNVCKDKFNSFDIFLSHATTTHLNNESDTIFKPEHQHFYDENLDNINPDVRDEYHAVKSENDKDYEGGEESDSTGSYIEDSLKESGTETECKDKSEGNSPKKELMPRHCEKCNKTFKKPSTLRRHLNVHLKQDNKIYECKICHQIFTSEQKRIYRNHRDRAHKEKIPCLLCEKTFRSKCYLDAHLKTHSGVKDFKCNICTAAFYSKTSLTEHARKTHLTPKVACRFCNKLFRAQGIQIHERIHTGEKPFVCEQCGTAFQRNSLLQNHIKRHNNDRRYECDICGKKFYNHTYLRDHKITHTDAKPYECLVCHARFNSGPALRKHKNLHLGVKKYHCKICGKAYAQGSGLYAHMKSHNIAEDKT